MSDVSLSVQDGNKKEKAWRDWSLKKFRFLRTELRKKDAGMARARFLGPHLWGARPERLAASGRKGTQVHVVYIALVRVWSWIWI